MTTENPGVMPVSAIITEGAFLSSNRQRLFVLYFTGTLIDLVILNLFNEFSDKVTVTSFTMSLLAAVLLQLLLKLTIALEHRVAAFFNSKSGALMKFLRFFCAWLVLFGSKFVILEALSFALGDSVHFSGAFHGIVWLVLVVVTMLVAEELVTRIYRRLS